MVVEEVGGVKEAEEGVGEIGMVSHGWVNGVDGEEGEAGGRRGEIGGEGEENAILTGGLEVRGMSGREGKDGRRGKKRAGEDTRRRVMGGVDQQIGKEEETGGPQIFLVVVAEEGLALQMVSRPLLGEALKGQDLLQGEFGGKGGGGMKEGGERTGEGGETITTRMTTCWRAATPSLPTTGMKRAGGRGRRDGKLRGRRRRRRGEGGGLHPTWTGITDKGEPMFDDSSSAPKALICSHLQRRDINNKVPITFLTFSTSDIMDQKAESPGMDYMR